jgi:hypothetical protein
MHWIKHSSDEGFFYTNDEGENIQAYANDARYPQFKADLDSGVHTFEDYAPDLNAEKENNERAWRDFELMASDLIMIQANSGELGRDKTAWKAYRQALRDYPASQDFPNSERPVSP